MRLATKLQSGCFTFLTFFPQSFSIEGADNFVRLPLKSGNQEFSLEDQLFR